jgi:hypothetical protein
MLSISRHRIVLPVLAFCLYWAGSSPSWGHWDSFDYLKQITVHRLSSLGIGRPVYIGYNVLVWELTKRIFRLAPLQVETVAVTTTVLLGVLGIVLFRRLSGQLLPSAAVPMAAVALLLSPVYALYSGLVMTEVPMLVALMASATILWNPHDRFPAWSDALSGLLFGIAIGIREQALTLVAAFLWILYSRSRTSYSRVRSLLFFGIPTASAVLIPAAAIYFCDPNGFIERTKIWFAAIPMGPVQFWNNVNASLLYTIALCPASWIALAVAGAHRVFHNPARNPTFMENAGKCSSRKESIANPLLGILCCMLLPIVFLWRDADVQMHPRYLLIVLPASLIVCTSLYRRWVPSRKGQILWFAAHLVFLGMAFAVWLPIRQTQVQKMEFARSIRNAIPDGGLIIAGNLSPVLDYYRGIGARPEWQIVWSGWDWDAKSVDATIRHSWSDGIPVYLSTDAESWRQFEAEFLELYFLLKDCRREPITHNLFRVYPHR